jgi:hypothetical protein
MTEGAWRKLIQEKLDAILARLDDVDARLARIESQGPAEAAGPRAGGKAAAATEGGFGLPS